MTLHRHTVGVKKVRGFRKSSVVMTRTAARPGEGIALEPTNPAESEHGDWGSPYVLIRQGEYKSRHLGGQRRLKNDLQQYGGQWNGTYMPQRAMSEADYCDPRANHEEDRPKN